MGRFDALTKIEPKEEPQGGRSPSRTEATERIAESGSMIPRHHGTTTPRYHDTVIPQKDNRPVALSQEDVFELVRKSVKKIGKEAATHRFTLEETHQLADIEYTYKRRGFRTTENELTRIAINYFIEDYRLNGERSLLAKLLEKINS